MRKVFRRTNVLWLLVALLAGSSLAVYAYREPLLVGFGQFLVHSQTPREADLIYVLAGDFWGSRVLVGSELGARGYAKSVMLSGGPYAGQNEGNMAVQFAVQHGYHPSLFLSVPLRARSTIEEAVELRPVFERLKAKRIILVTANFHSRRAGLVFRLFVPGVRFYTVAAPDKDFDVRSWWRTDTGRHLFFSEYRKLMGTWVAKAGAW